MKEYGHSEILKQLRTRCTNGNTQTIVAQQLGISQQTLSKILSGQFNISQKVAKRLGYIRVVRYRRISNEVKK